MKVLKLFEIANRAAAPMALKNVARLLKMMWDRPVNKLMIAKCEAANWDAGDESLREFLWKFFQAVILLSMSMRKHLAMWHEWQICLGATMVSSVTKLHGTPVQLLCHWTIQASTESL